MPVFEYGYEGSGVEYKCECVCDVCVCVYVCLWTGEVQRRGGVDAGTASICPHDRCRVPPLFRSRLGPKVSTRSLRRVPPLSRSRLGPA